MQRKKKSTPWVPRTKKRIFTIKLQVFPWRELKKKQHRTKIFSTAPCLGKRNPSAWSSKDDNQENICSATVSLLFRIQRPVSQSILFYCNIAALFTPLAKMHVQGTDFGTRLGQQPITFLEKQPIPMKLPCGAWSILKRALESTQLFSKTEVSESLGQHFWSFNTHILPPTSIFGHLQLMEVEGPWHWEIEPLTCNGLNTSMTFFFFFFIIYH